MRIVLAVIAASLFLALVAIVRLFAWGVRRRRGRDVRRRAVVIADRVLLGAGIVGLALFVYGRWIEPRRVEVITVELPLAGMPAGASPVRVVHVSDIHTPTNAWLQRQLPALVAELRPDVIAFTGDGVNALEHADAFRATMGELARVAPTVAVYGNTDAAAMPRDVGLFDGTGARELRGTREPLMIRGVPLNLVGASRQDDWKRVRSALRGVPAGEVAVYLSHSPDVADDVARWGADVILAGHTHGGQVALPMYGALWTASRYGKRFEHGRYRVGDAWLYINRGIGMEKLLPEVRLFARPEVSLLLLRPQ